MMMNSLLIFFWGAETIFPTITINGRISAWYDWKKHKWDKPR